MSGTGRPDPRSDRERKAVLAALTGQWQKLHVLAEASGLSERRVQVVLHDLTLEGQPIVTGSAGVRLTDLPSVVYEAARSLDNRWREIWARAAALHRTARRLRAERDGQPTHQTDLPLDTPAPAA